MSATAHDMISLRGIGKTYASPGGAFQALAAIDLTICRGEFVAVVGQSGSGKSTLLNLLGGIDRPSNGQIHIDGEALHALPEKALSAWRGRTVGIVFQFFQLLPTLTAAENVMLPMDFGKRWPTRERRPRALDLLARLGVADQADKLPGASSGGQQQRVAVARALAHEPAVLLLDEPFGALDAKIRVELRETVRAVQQRIGMTTILVTHDQEEAFALADRMGVMQMGRLLETGSPEELYRHPTTRFVARFLGAANLFLGEVSDQGLRLGTAVLAPQRASVAATLGNEAVLLVRPEDIEIAARSGAPLSPPASLMSAK